MTVISGGYSSGQDGTRGERSAGISEMKRQWEGATVKLNNRGSQAYPKLKGQDLQVEKAHHADGNMSLLLEFRGHSGTYSQSCFEIVSQEPQAGENTFG